MGQDLQSSSQQMEKMAVVLRIRNMPQMTIRHPVAFLLRKIQGL